MLPPERQRKWKTSLVHINTPAALAPLLPFPPRLIPSVQRPETARPHISAPAGTSSLAVGYNQQLQWAGDVGGEAQFTYTNLYRSGAPTEAVRITADAAFGALATWLGEQQRLVERAFEASAQHPRCPHFVLSP